SASSDSFYEGGSSRLYRRSVVQFLPEYHVDQSCPILFLEIYLPADFSSAICNCQVLLKILTGWFRSESFYSEDYGKSFHDVSHAINNTFIKKDFGISAGPGNPQQVNRCANIKSEYPFKMSYDGLWLSQDFGNSWSEVHKGVHTFTWSSSIFFFFFKIFSITFFNQTLILRRMQDCGKNFTTIAKNIFSFGYIGGFLFTSVMEKLVWNSDNMYTQASPRVIYVSSDQGDHFKKAQLPSATTEQFYSVLDGDEDMIFMHVDNPGDTYFGTIYTSDDRGILYSKSLERHLFGGEGKSDFTNVTSLRGVCLTNILEEGMNVCFMLFICLKGCPKGYHFSGITPMLPLSEPTAIGLVIAHGTSYTWWGTLRGPHHYTILDSGGLIVAVEAHRDRQISSIKLSTDEGQCWKIFNFTDHPIFLAGLASEPGTKTMNISIFGFRDEQDYVQWLALSDYDSDSDPETDGCLLGYKETFRRLKKLSACRNGRGYVVSRQQHSCPCTRDDYMCEYGFYLHENTSECLLQADFLNQTQDICLNGELDDLQHTGYRKIPGDKCEGGFSPPRREDSFKNLCGKDISPASSNSHTVTGHAGSYCGVYLCGGHWFGYYCSFNNHLKENKL
uniref:Si:dkey-159a18.1 n=1 Tax=Sinocyclocheilus rhinocerous TaxID=307959 RepID=A0A673H846_9TELE